MSLSINNKNKQLFKILVAAAWIDGEFQPEEKEYLFKIAQEQELNEDPEIQQLLSNEQPISSTKCYQLLKKYLGEHPGLEDYNNLLSAISSLVYSDSDIATEEAKLLTQLQEVDPNNSSLNSVFDQLLGRIQKLYKKGCNQ